MRFYRELPRKDSQGTTIVGYDRETAKELVEDTDEEHNVLAYFSAHRAPGESLDEIEITRHATAVDVLEWTWGDTDWSQARHVINELHMALIDDAATNDRRLRPVLSDAFNFAARLAS
jgi:hypothetical protein